MRTPHRFRKPRALHFAAVVALVLAVVAPMTTPVYATTTTDSAEQSPSLSGALPAWWATAGSQSTADAEPYRALPGWWPPTEIVSALPARPLVQGSVTHFDVATLSATATAGEPFSTTVEARAADESRVGITTTVVLATNEGESISPASTLLISGVVTENVTLTTAGVNKLIRVISDSVTGETTINVTPAPAVSMDLLPPDSTITAGGTQAYQATAYDSFGNEIDVTSSTDFLIDAGAAGTWVANVYTSQKAGTWTVLGTYQNSLGQDVTATATLTVEPGALDHIRINSGPGGAPAVGTHTMDLYDTFAAWAGCYDAFDNYCGDEDSDWGGTGVVALGEFTPGTSPTTVFTPAPIVSGTGTITATPVAPGAGDSTGQFVIQAPWLIISKSGSPDPVPAGDELGYNINYSNVGNAAAPSVIVTETYDPNVSYVLSNKPPAQGDNVWVLGGLAPGASGSLFVVVRTASSLEPDTVLTNVVTVGGPRLGQYAFTETTAVTSTPELTLTLSGSPNPVEAGNYLNYQLHYENQGNQAVNNVRITMTYDTHVSYVTATPAPSTGTDNVWTVNRLKGGNGGDISIWVVVDDYMEDLYTLTTTGTITSDEEGPYEALEHTIVHAPALELAKRATPDPALANERLLYTLIYTNVGHAEATGLVITDAVPVNSDYVRCQPRPCSHSDGIVTWEAGSLAEGQSRTATMEVAVNRNIDSGKALTNTARVRVFDTPAYSATAQITTTVISSPSLSLAMDNGTTFVHAGEELEYTVDYANSGSGRAYNTVITVTPPSPLHVKDVNCVPSSDCVLSEGELIYSIGTVDGGAEGTVQFTATVIDPLPAGARRITATAVISTVTPGDPAVGNVAQDADGIATQPDLVVTADYQSIMPWPGKRVTYSVEYENKGHIATTGVVIEANRPPFSSFKKGDSDPCWVSQGGGRYRCALGELDFKEGGELPFVVALTTADFTPDMTNFDASFLIYDDGASGEDANPDDNLFEAALGIPNLVVDRVIVEPSVWRGEPGFVWAIIKNTGSGLACGIYDPNGLCTSFATDLFIDPATPPPSYPIEGFGDCYVWVTPLAAGASKTAVISFTLDPALRYLPGYCGADVFSALWVKADNWDPDADPYPADYGVVPENNEYDNVKGPIFPGYLVFLPVIMNLK